MEKQDKLKKKIKEVERNIESFDSGRMIKIKISGIVKQVIRKVVETPLERELTINEYLFVDKEKKKKFIENIKNQFPKGSIINIEEVK